MAKKNSKTPTFDFPEAYRQLKNLEYDLQEAEAGDTRRAALKAFCDAEHAFQEALRALPKPRRCKHQKREDGKCVRCGVKFVACTGEAHSNANIDHCMCCLPWGWGEVPEHKPNVAINEMVEALR